MNRARSLAFAALVAASSVAGLGCARADWREEVPVFRIGILGGGLEERRLKDHACLKAKAEQALKVPVDLSASRDYGGMTEGLLAGRLDAAGLGVGGYAGIFLQNPDAIEPIVTVILENGVASGRVDATWNGMALGGGTVRLSSPAEACVEIPGTGSLCTPL